MIDENIILNQYFIIYFIWNSVLFLKIKIFFCSSIILFLTLSSLKSDVSIDFDKWKKNIKIEALDSGISSKTFDLSFKDVKLIKRVIELDRNQPEFKLTFEDYLSKVVNANRRKAAKIKLNENLKILDEIEKKYKVQKRFIIALWGIETNFGKNLGSFPVISSLTTLAFDGRRSNYFKKELINALKIIEEGHIMPNEMKGSWAGAMGQCQFMPSSFLNYATDWNNDGKKDIWNTKNDVFASIANYLKSVGWRDDITWGRNVLLPIGKKIDFKSFSNKKIYKTMDEWSELGIKTKEGENLPSRNIKSRMIIPKKSNNKVYLVYENFENILDWNRSNYFAIAVGVLSDSLINFQKYEF